MNPKRIRNRKIRDAEILKMLWQGVSSKNVGEHFNLSRSRINQIYQAYVAREEARSKRIGFAQDVLLYSTLLNLRRITSKLYLALAP